MRALTTRTETRSEWSARVYGHGWRATRERYQRSRFTLKRCIWCWRPGPHGLNHITYALVRCHKEYGAGWTPLLTIVPMCRRCRDAEAAITRTVRRHVRGRRRRWVHGGVIVGLPIGVLVAVGLLLYILMLGVGAW